MTKQAKKIQFNTSFVSVLNEKLLSLEWEMDESGNHRLSCLETNISGNWASYEGIAVFRDTANSNRNLIILSSYWTGILPVEKLLRVESIYNVTEIGK